MGKILLIEPHKVLRQAITLFLFPEHEVQVEEGLRESVVESLKDYDLLIADGAALRQNDQLSPEFARALRNSKTPTMWLEDEEPSRPPKHDKLMIVKKPIQREEFQSTLEALLSPETARRGKTDVPMGAAKKRQPEASHQETFQFIDLVDVVEEQRPPRQGRKSTRKSK